MSESNPVASDPTQSKRVADRYLKREVLGEGTYGVVFKAIDTKVGSRVYSDISISPDFFWGLLFDQINSVCVWMRFNSHILMFLFFYRAFGAAREFCRLRR